MRTSTKNNIFLDSEQEPRRLLPRLDSPLSTNSKLMVAQWMLRASSSNLEVNTSLLEVMVSVTSILSWPFVIKARYQSQPCLPLQASTEMFNTGICQDE